MSDLGDAEINLTPLIDVVFVILIMFIIVAPLLQVDQVELAESISSENVEMKSAIAIHVLQDDSIQFNGTHVSLKELAQKLQHAKEQHPTSKPQLFQDKGSHFGAYQSVKNIVAAAGFDQLDVILKPE